MYLVKRRPGETPIWSPVSLSEVCPTWLYVGFLPGDFERVRIEGWAPSAPKARSG